MLIQIDAKMAALLAPLVGNQAAFAALYEYSELKIKDLYDQFTYVDPSNSAKVGKIQGQISELKALLALQNDVRAVVKGSN